MQDCSKRREKWQSNDSQFQFFTAKEGPIKNPFGQKFALIETFKTKQKYWVYHEI